MLEGDLHARWRPSDEQICYADALLAAGADKDRDSEEGKQRGVYSLHLLLHKCYGFWTSDVEITYLDGFFFTRKHALAALQVFTDEAWQTLGIPLVGGWAWHFASGEWAVWEDILSRRGEK